MPKAIQDLYPDELSVCYGCGRNHPDGLHVKTYLVGEHTIALFKPDQKYTAIPGMVYGGLVASILDCHGTGSAAAFICKEEGIPLDKMPVPVRCATANLKVDFLKPTPMGVELELKGQLVKIEGRKVWVSRTLSAQDEVCVKGEVLAIRLK